MSTDKPLVLIVDDEPHNIHSLASILANDCRALFAMTGEAALARAQDRAIDLILLDVMLPGSDGIEICRQLKADPHTAGIPVIFVTALTEEADEARGFDAGGVDYIHKPFRPALVRARVRTHLRLKSALGELDALARSDRLTGTWNRRHFEERTQYEIDRHLRYPAPMALVLIDLDHFKSINDRHGHVVGDRVLAELVERLRPALRRSDVLARWGGEEFCLLMPEASLAEALYLAERLRAAVAGTAFAEVGGLSASFGVAEFSAGQTLVEWFERADQALYRAKAAGRNTVCS